MAKYKFAKNGRNNIISALSFLGILDTLYLLYEHYFPNPDGTCGIGPFSGCGPVLTSKYSEFFGIPIALFGFLFYVSVFILVLLFKVKNKLHPEKYIIFPLTFGAFIFSTFLMYLQFVLIKSFCAFCTFSAINSTLIFILTWNYFERERREFFVYFVYLTYKYFVKNILFLIKADKVHEAALAFGFLLGKSKIIKYLFNFLFKIETPELKRKVAGINFPSLVGLAAGFDYEAKLTQIIPHIGFGFMTVGTITNMPYGGNPKPMLGRLPKSRSLLVNKGFKNLGAVQTIKNLEGKDFEIPVGISIGRTNIKSLNTQTQSVNDIVKAFKLFEKSKVKHSFYELNISCPNLYGDISFYLAKNLDELLSAVDKLKIKRPVFVKMPIGKSNKEFIDMLKVIDKHKVTGLIIGNLQTDWKHKGLNPDEVKKFKMGNFSGKPTFERSNELIALTRKLYKKRFFIIGCGGVFNGRDAYKKLEKGSDLVQLVTGLIYEGPTLPIKISLELKKIVRKKGVM